MCSNTGTFQAMLTSVVTACAVKQDKAQWVGDALSETERRGWWVRPDS